MTAPNEDLKAVTAATVIDARSSACPGPLLEAKKGIGAVPLGEVMEVWSGSHDTCDNLSRWCTKTGNDYMGYLDEGAYVRVFVRRQK
jgi:tRNA 2-thiouridine synthesizing protein A